MCYVLRRLIPLLTQDSAGVVHEFTRPFVIGVNSNVVDLVLPLPADVVHADLDRNQVYFRPGLFVQFPTKIKHKLSKAVRTFLSSLLVDKLQTKK